MSNGAQLWNCTQLVPCVPQFVHLVYKGTYTPASPLSFLVDSTAASVCRCFLSHIKGAQLWKWKQWSPCLSPVELTAAPRKVNVVMLSIILKTPVCAYWFLSHMNGAQLWKWKQWSPY